MASGEVYSTLARLLQIEGPSFACNVRDTFKQEGIPQEDVEKVLAWAIGEDFNRIQLKYWPHRLQERLKLDVKTSDRIQDGIRKIAEAWKNRETDSGSSELRGSQDGNDDVPDPQPFSTV